MNDFPRSLTVLTISNVRVGPLKKKKSSIKLIFITNYQIKNMMIVNNFFSEIHFRNIILYFISFQFYFYLRLKNKSEIYLARISQQFTSALISTQSVV